MNLEKFKENLLVYGTDIHEWPEEIRRAGLKAIETSSQFRMLLEEEVRFEKVLKARTYEGPNHDLTERIILASKSKNKKVRPRLVELLSELVWEFGLSKPVMSALYVSLVLVLLLGFAIGFTNINGSVSIDGTQTDLQEFLYYEGEVL
jgi:hypothetical protein